jgi:hypothetical protein
MKPDHEQNKRSTEARGLWQASDRLRVKAAQLRDEAAALDENAERLHSLAAAIQDGRI